MACHNSFDVELLYITKTPNCRCLSTKTPEVTTKTPLGNNYIAQMLITKTPNASVFAVKSSPLPRGLFTAKTLTLGVLPILRSYAIGRHAAKQYTSTADAEPPTNTYHTDD